MTHRFPIKEIAAQAGLGTATVDRVLNDRPNVAARTRARVAAAIAELTRMEEHIAARGRNVWIDVVVEAPARFSREVEQATAAALPLLRPVVVRPRIRSKEVMPAAEVARALHNIGKRGAQGVILKARDVPEVRAAVAALQDRGIPVVTLVTDIAGRAAYAGLDNAQAGRVAAGVLRRMAPDGGTVLISASRADFAGEAERIMAFQAHLPDGWRVVSGTAGAGLNTATGAAVSALLKQVGRVDAVYSTGGGNRAICAAIEAAGQQPRVFVAHDLDMDNRDLLARGAIDVVLHHDLTADLAHAMRHILAAQRLVPVPEAQAGSPVQIILAENLPAD